MLESVLQKLGFSNKEIEVYKTCLELGARPASIIAHKLDLPRSTARVLMDQLVKKHFLQKRLKGNTQIYVPMLPENIAQSIEIDKLKDDKKFEENISKLRKSFPEIESMMLKEVNLPKVQLFEGVEGVKTLYQSILDEGFDLKSIEETGSLYYKILPKFADYFANERVKRGINNMCVCPNTDLLVKQNNTDKLKLRETRYLSSKKFPFTCDIRVYHNNVSIITLDEESPLGIKITHPKIAKQFSLMFDALWNLAKKYDHQ